MEKNCLDCLYANYFYSGLVIGDILGEDHRLCEHVNSPYYKEIVGNGRICRLFIDEKEYFRNKDLRDKIEHLKNRMR